MRGSLGSLGEPVLAATLLLLPLLRQQPSRTCSFLSRLVPQHRLALEDDN